MDYGRGRHGCRFFEKRRWGWRASTELTVDPIFRGRPNGHFSRSFERGIIDPLLSCASASIASRLLHHHPPLIFTSSSVDFYIIILRRLPEDIRCVFPCGLAWFINTFVSPFSTVGCWLFIIMKCRTKIGAACYDWQWIVIIWPADYVVQYDIIFWVYNVITHSRLTFELLLSSFKLIVT